MKLSEALRLGAMTVPPVHGPFFARGVDGRICGACALGAIAVAAGFPEPTSVAQIRSAISERWPWTLSRFPTSISYSVTQQHVASHIVSLFEVHNWTREQIAEWVESIEPAEENAQPQSQPTPECETVQS